LAVFDTCQSQEESEQHLPADEKQDEGPFDPLQIVSLTSVSGWRSPDILLTLWE